MPVAPLPPEAIQGRPLDAGLAFDTTDDLDDLAGPFGQERAAEALALAIDLRAPGYNAYVMGPTGQGKRELVRSLLERAAAAAPTPSDWCYLNDFADGRRPRAVRLPPGRATGLRRDLDRLMDELRAAIPAAFENADYRTRLALLEKELDGARERALDGVRRAAAEREVALLRTPMGFGLAPVKDGEVLDPDQFHHLPQAEQQRRERDIAELQGRLQEILRAMPDLERRHRERVKELNRDVALYAAGHLLDELRRRHADLPAVLAHLQAIQADVADHVHELLAAAEGDADAAIQLRKLLEETPTLRRYAANVMVDHADRQGAPVVDEDLPTLANLVGRIEHHARFGALVTDFTLIRPGALHRANGGYLVLDARRLLAQPFAWDELKRMLRSGEIRIETPERLVGLAATSTLEPEPIPLEVKVVLVGDRLAWQLLSTYDPEFPVLFKVAADFDDDVPRTPETERAFARRLGTLARRDRLRPVERAAVERLAVEAGRLAGDAGRLSTEVDALRDLLREADRSAARAGRARVAAADVVAALAAQERRVDRIPARLREELVRGTLVVETAGRRIGQVNGLSVLGHGRRPFGHPSRITAQVRLGRGEVVDIEREVALGGPIHSKGVLILAGYLGARYCRERPLTVAATLVFEQSYGGVEGDSASAAELCALLSAIGEVPLRQDLALTGSVDQLGRIQAVGGVTEKVEGFFGLCEARGLTGAEGVLLPAANVPHLVLRDEVVRAVAERRFAIYPVASVEEALELLSGLPCAGPGAAPPFPDGTFEARVAARLEAMAQRARAFAAPAGGRGKDDD